MAFEDEQLDQAFASLDVIKVAAHFGIKLRQGVQKSPFRQDKKGASFSVYSSKNGRDDRFKDHADDDVAGGVWKMVGLCAPQMLGGEIRDLLVELSGQIPRRQSRGEVKRKVIEKRKDLYAARKRKQSEIPKLNYPEPSVWPEWLRGRWNEGQAALGMSNIEGSLLAGLAKSRGWSERVMRSLVGLDKTSLPLLPWDWSGKQRAWAWKVEKPFPVKGRGGKELILVPVGYHGRYKFREKDGSILKKWHFVPSVPEPKRADGSLKKLTEFQRDLVDYKTKCPPYPFVLGDLSAPRLVIILEGQFDAVSFADAFRWLENGFPAGVCVLGLRGVSSPAVMLSAYGVWLQKNQPKVWIIGDGDAAGRKLGALDQGNEIVPEKMPFTDRLRGLGCEVRAEVIRQPGCKDFNDVFKQGRPPLEIMQKWAKARGFGELV